MTEALQEIQDKLRAILSKYCPPLTAKVDTPGRYELYSIKDLVIGGRKRSEVYFGGAIIQKSFVGFYFMPMYGNPEFIDGLSPELRKCIKGKACLNIKKADQNLLKEIEKMTRDGFKIYKRNKWIA
ncbi:MAG TPA: hypothetical protein VKJ45_28370 [Blastocatellia bacterium]|nr:hypothetical protein [Blastocatellia bacterium]